MLEKDAKLNRLINYLLSVLLLITTIIIAMQQTRIMRNENYILENQNNILESQNKILENQNQIAIYDEQIEVYEAFLEVVNLLKEAETVHFYMFDIYMVGEPILVENIDTEAYIRIMDRLNYWGNITNILDRSKYLFSEHISEVLCNYSIYISNYIKCAKDRVYTMYILNYFNDMGINISDVAEIFIENNSAYPNDEEEISRIMKEETADYTDSRLFMEYQFLATNFEEISKINGDDFILLICLYFEIDLDANTYVIFNPKGEDFSYFEEILNDMILEFQLTIEESSPNSEPIDS